MEVLEYIKRSDNFKLIARELESAMSHAYMLISNDKMLLGSYATLMTRIIMCEYRGCGRCDTCKKIELHSHPDVAILPKGDSIKVEDVEYILDSSTLVPMENTDKVYVLDKFSDTNLSAQNKLLKVLEEPPKNVHFILLVSNENNVLPTIKSRCKKFYVNKLESSIITEILKANGVSGDNLNKLCELSDGNLTRLNSLINNGIEIEINKVVLDTISTLSFPNLLNKANILLGYKGSFTDILETFEQYYLDVLRLTLGQEDLVLHKSELVSLKEISSAYTPTGVDLIIKRIYLIKKQLISNCSVQMMTDNLLMYILEVKKKCSTEL